MRNVRVKPVIATLLLATALTTFGCMRSPKGETLMADKPKTPVVLRDAQEEVKSPKRMLDAVPVPQKKEETKGKIEKVPEGTLITTEGGMKILKRNDGTVEIIERPRKKPVIEFIH